MNTTESTSPDDVPVPPPGTVVIKGEAPTLAETKLREASAELLVKREEHGRDATTALIGQIAVVGSFLGAFGLLNDAAKAAVVQSEWSQWALVAAATSLGFSLSTYFLLPARMPSLDQPDELREFWNNRVRARRALLICALIALGVAVFAATKAFEEARGAVAPTPAATVSGKFTPAKDTSSSLEATATWVGLEPGELAILCVVGPNREALGGAIGAAASDGKQAMTLTVPVAGTTTGEVTITTVRLASAPREDETAATSCAADVAARVGESVSSSITVG